MISVIIVDDEQSALKSMQWEITNFCEDVTIVGSFSSAMEAKKFLNENTVDCVFLDIEMPEMDGFQFLDSFKNRNFSVVITTAYDQYAIKAIKEKALDYLLKPIDSDDLKSCIEKITQFKEELSIHERLEKTLENMIQKSHPSKKISVSCDGKIIFLNPDDIVYCESDGNYCSIFLENKDKIFISQKLKFMEEKLLHLYFFRIHNSHLINLAQVKSYTKGKGGFVTLKDGTSIEVSVRRKDDFLKAISNCSNF